MTTFADLKLIPQILSALDSKGYKTPTPIQADAIPPLLEGRDVLGCAQTGTGKTAAFALPVIQHIHQSPGRGKPVIRALVLSPTRELVSQIGDNFQAYATEVRVRHTVIFGGVKQGRQVDILRRGVDVLVATPGRLLDLMGQGYIDLSNVDFFILDEADRMLDMGFIHDIRRVLKELPARRQNLLFSATMPDSIAKLAGGFMHDPVRIDITPPASTVELITQRVMFVAREDKKRLLADLLDEPGVERSIVFTRTKHGANRLVKQLDRYGISAAAIHGNKSQGARERALAGFKSGAIPVLVATDIASRGIDVEDVTHVFNYELPNESESYVHRIGRTGRAGKGGVAVAFCDDTEGGYLRDIEHLIGFRIPMDENHAYHSERLIPALNARTPSKSARRRATAKRKNVNRRDRPARRDRPRGADPKVHGHSSAPEKRDESVPVAAKPQENKPNPPRRYRRRNRSGGGSTSAGGNQGGRSGNQSARSGNQSARSGSQGRGRSGNQGGGNQGGRGGGQGERW